MEVTSYEKNYQKLAFEDEIRQYRIGSIIESVKRANAKHILEIGCGYEPLFSYFNEYESMTIVEPGKQFFNLAIQKAEGNSRITLYNGMLEEYFRELSSKHFDFIIIGGFLHEISNPEEVLQNIHTICKPDTVVFCFAPNAHSFHRLLAYEAGLIDSIYTLSGTDKLFNRHQVFDFDSIEKLFNSCKFSIRARGSYYIKPFTSSQMAQISESKIIGKDVIDGLSKMIRYLPDMGAELYVEAVI